MKKRARKGFGHRAALLAGAVLMLAGTVAAPNDAHAVICANAGAGANSGDDGAVASNTACGQDAAATGGGASAYGNLSTASGAGSSAYGLQATASGAASSAYGNLSTASGIDGSAYGALSTASGTDSSAYGIASTASGSSSSAYGVASMASGGGSSAFGLAATAVGVSSVAVGDSALAQGASSVAVGDSAQALGDGSIAIGKGAVASGSIAIGVGAVAAAGGTAVGDGASATLANSAAWGTGATATRANQQVFGTATNTYTTPGITSAASKAAQGAPTHFVTSNAAGDLAAHTPAELGLASSNDFGALQSQINRLGRRDEELADGIAIALALAQPIFQPGQTFAMRAGWGNFDGNDAVGVTVAGVIGRGYWGPTSAVVLDGGIGTGTSEGVVAGRAGITFGW